MIDVYSKYRPKPIFLDFLNREASAASGNSRGEIDDFEIIEILLLTHCARLSVNISQMVEYCYDRSKLSEWLKHLIRSDILITTSYGQNISDFLTERQKIYCHDKPRYPMYFQETEKLEGFEIRSKNSFSMTSLLRRDLMDMEPLKLTLSATRGHDSDVDRVRSNIDFFKEVMVTQKDAAITKSVFMKRIDQLGEDGKIVISSAGKLFSALYMQHYASLNDCAVCTGILGTSYREDANNFPNYDVPILRYIIESLGYYRSEACRSARKGRSLEHYGSLEHRRFSYLCGAFVDSLVSMICAQTTDLAGSSGAWPSVRAQAASVIHSIFSEVQSIGKNSPRTIREFLEAGTAALEKVGERLAKNDTFQRRWRLYVPDASEVRFLIATATGVEDDSVHAALIKAGYFRGAAVSYGKGLAARYTKLGSNEILVCRSSAGGSGVSGSHLTISEAVGNLKPRYVIAAGICFGFKGRDVKIGDIIVSTSVANYEMVRQGASVVERGDRIPSGPTLLSAARYVISHRRAAGGRPSAREGLVLSGDKLVDDKDFIDDLKKRFPDALGGEMEGVGLSSSAVADGTEWIIVKAICDWGYKKDKKHQSTAAQNSAEFVAELIGALVEAESPQQAS